MSKLSHNAEPEDRLQVMSEIIGLLRQRYEHPECGSDAVAAALVTLVGVQEARRLLGA